MASKYRALDICGSPDLEMLRDFVLAVLNSPQLAAQVMSLKYDPDSWRQWVKSSIPYTIDNEADEYAERTFKSALEAQKWPADDAVELLNRLMAIKSAGFYEPTTVHLNPDAVVALILPVLPNLHSWHVGNTHLASPWKFTQKALMRSTQAVAVQHVTIIPNHCYSDGFYCDYAFDNFAAFALLPRLKSISGSGVGGIHIEDTGSYADIPRHASDVEEIELLDCELGSACLSSILHFSRGLRKFAYRTGGRALLDGSSAAIYGREIRTALEAHRRGLRVLDLEFDIRLRGQDAWEDDEGQRQVGEKGDTEDIKSHGRAPAPHIVQDFPVFPHLTHLRIGYKMLMGLVMSSPSGTERLIDWLPSTLEELTVIGYRAEKTVFRSLITEVLENKNERFPKLTVRGIDEVIGNKEDLDDEEDYRGEGSGIESGDERDDVVIKPSRYEGLAKATTSVEGDEKKYQEYGQEDKEGPSKRRKI